MRFDDRMAARIDLDENVFDEFRPAIVARRCHRGEAGEHVELRQGPRDALQSGEVRGKQRQQLVVKRFLE